MYAGEAPAEAEGAATGENESEGAAEEKLPDEYAAAFDVNSGKELWRTAIGQKYDTEFGNGPRSTPTVDGDTVYVIGSRGDLAALSTEDGSVRFALSLTETFGGKIPHWGFSTSVLVDEDQLVVHAGGEDGKSYAGLDKLTGEVRWTSGKGTGYNSPIAVTMNGKRRIVYLAGGQLRCIDREGDEVWTHEWPEGETHATPLFIPPDRIYASGAEGVGAAVLEVVEKDGSATAEPVWESRFIRNHFNQSVIHDGHVYGFDNATIKCIDVADAKMTWRKRGLGKGSLVYADGHLYVLSDRGRLLLLEATPEGYVEKGSMQALEGRCWTSPTLAAGRLYLRNHGEMVSFDIRN